MAIALERVRRASQARSMGSDMSFSVSILDFQSTDSSQPYESRLGRGPVGSGKGKWAWILILGKRFLDARPAENTSTNRAL